MYKRGFFSILLIIFIMIIIFNFYLYSKNHNITGFFTKDEFFYDKIEQSFEKNSIFLLSPSEPLDFSYFGISGNASGDGFFRVSLVSDDDNFIIINEKLNNEKVLFKEYSAFKNKIDLSKKYLLRIETENVKVFLDSIYYSTTKLGLNSFDKTELNSVFIPQNITIDYDGRYDLLKTENGFDLMIKNTTIKGMKQSSKVFYDFINDSNIKTEVFAMESVDIDNATVVLNKKGNVEVIKKCDNFLFDAKFCVSGWYDTKIPFDSDNQTISFVVDSFSAYGGGETYDIQWDSSTSPGNITNISSQSGETWIYWTWSDPNDSDFNHTEVWVDNVFKINTTLENYNATNLTSNSTHEIGLIAVDNSNNKSNWFNSTAMTSEGNSKPKLNFVEFDPYELNYLNDAIVIGIYNDSNGDLGNISFEWFVNDVNVFNNSKVYNSGDWFNDTLKVGNFSLGDNVSVKIVANDGFLNSNIIEINDSVGLVGPIIESFYLSSDYVGLGIQINFSTNVSEGNFSIDSAWINLSNSKENITINLTKTGNIWFGNYTSFVYGINYVDLYVNDTNGIIEHWKKQFSVGGTFNINIEVDKTNYTLNELVTAIGLP